MNPFGAFVESAASEVCVIGAVFCMLLLWCKQVEKLTKDLAAAQSEAGKSSTVLKGKEEQIIAVSTVLSID